MDFSDKTMASPASACLGQVPRILRNSIMPEDSEEEEEEREEVNLQGFYLTWTPKHGKEMSSESLFNGQLPGEEQRHWRSISPQGPSW